MSPTTDITCPYCWQTIDLELPPPDPAPVEFVVDCEVCCRPIRVVVTRRDPEEEPEVTVEAEAD